MCDIDIVCAWLKSVCLVFKEGGHLNAMVCLIWVLYVVKIVMYRAAHFIISGQHKGM